MPTEFYLDYTQLSQDEINKAFISSCAVSNLKAAEHLLFSKEPPFNAQWDIVKFSAFKVSCFNNNEDVLKFLIIKLNMEKSFEVDEFLDQPGNKMASKLFLDRNLNFSNNKKIFNKI